MSLRRKPRFSLFQFSILLRHFRPTIWRRVQCKDCTLRELHDIILAAFGFEGEHTFRFSRRQPECFDHTCASGDECRETLVLETWLSQLVPVDGTELNLRYQFGDVNRWYFKLVYEDCLLSAYDTDYPHCVDGERADMPRDMLPMRFDGYLADNADDADWRALGLVRPQASDPAFFSLAAVNTRLHALGLSRHSDVERRGCEVIRVQLTEAERSIVFEHGSLEPDERERLAAHASRGVLRVYLPEALALARHLARAANGVSGGRLQRRLERLSGRFQRHAYAWIQRERELVRSVKEECFGGRHRAAHKR